MLKERKLRGQKNASQSKIETPPQGWRRAGDAIADGDKLNKIVLAGCDVKFYTVRIRTDGRSQDARRQAIWLDALATRADITCHLNGT